MTTNELARNTYEKISDINDNISKMRFLIEELTDTVNPIEYKTEKENITAYYCNRKRHHNYSEILLDYICNVEQEVKAILEYLDSTQFKEILTDGEKGFKGSSTASE